MCSEYNIVQRDQAPICPVDASGCFTSEVTDFAGQYVKVSDTSYIYMEIKFTDVSAILLLKLQADVILGISGSIILIAVLNWHFIMNLSHSRMFFMLITLKKVFPVTCF